jgi:hypothetical protein
VPEPAEYHFAERTYRYGNKIDLSDYPDIDRLSPQQVRELIEFMGPEGLVSLDGFLDDPFETPRIGRFSDGTYGVFYSALDLDTARMEAKDFFDWLVKEGLISRYAYYRCFSVMFQGKVLDLRNLGPGYAYLTAEEGVAQSRQLAASSREAGIDGFLTASAARARRGETGTCLPVFTRAALSNAEETGVGEKFTV